MPAIAHISDLHFGKEDPPVAEALLADLQARGAPAGRGQRRPHPARARQGVPRGAGLPRPSARPVLVVPGNHDVPLFDVVCRASRARCATTAGTSPRTSAPFLHHEDLAVMGVNTARSWTFKNGRISWAQIEQIRERFAPLPERVFKVLVTHHPFVPSPAIPIRPWSAAASTRCRRRRRRASTCSWPATCTSDSAATCARTTCPSGARCSWPRRARPSRCARAASPTPTTGSRSSRPHLVIEVRGWGDGRVLDPVRHALGQARPGMGARVALGARFAG